jgi:hypothetical protein
LDRHTWFSRRAFGLHALIIVIVPTFAALCIWQVNRALGGNDLSWAYVFEWPFFAGYAVYMWWRFLHETPLDDAPPNPAQPTDNGSGNVLERSVNGSNNSDDRESSEGDSDAADRAAYNTYLAELAERDKPKQWH